LTKYLKGYGKDMDSHILLVSGIFSFASTLLSYFCIKTFLNDKRKVSLWKVILILLFITTIRFLSNNLPDTIINSVVSITLFIISTFLVAVICFRPKIRLAVMSTIFFWFCIASSEILAAVIVTGFHGISLYDLIQSDVYNYQFNILIGLVVLVVFMIIRRVRIKIFSAISTKMLVALFLLQVLFFIFTSYLVMHPFSPHGISTIEVIATLGIIIVKICVFILIENIAKSSEKNRVLTIIEAQNTAQQRYIKQLLETQEQIKKMSHDFKHHVNMLYILCKEQRTDELLENLSKLGNTYDDSLIVETGNIMLDTMLSAKQEEARAQGIDFKLKLDIKADTSYLSLDLCVLLSNGLDNAIEACQRAGNVAKIIEMETITTPTRFMCRMRNTLGAIPLVEEGLLKTKKQDSLRHGIGLQSMKQTCNKLGGDIDYEYDDEFFMVHISIPL